MARCGCSDDSIVVDDGHGIDVTEHHDGVVVHYTPNVDGSVLTGNGITWDPQRRRFAVKLAGSGAGLAFDGAGGLYATNTNGGGGGRIPGASVADLAARAAQQNVVGGYFGAGYLIKPQSTRGSYTYGVQRGLDLMHVPTRLLSDGTPVVTPDEYLGVQNGNLPGELAVNQDIHRWRIMANKCGAWPPQDASLPVGAPSQGWFGYLEPAEHGLLSLADVFDLVGRSSVLAVELQFPPIGTDEGGNLVWQHPERAPTDQQVATFLDRVRVLISRYGLAQSVIVMTGSPQVPTSGGGKPVAVLDGFHQAAITTGPVFATTADANRYPPASWPADWSWAVMSTGIDPATVKTYVDVGVRCLYAVCTRQHQHHDLVQPSGAAGVLSGDPEYYAGNLPSHPTAGGYAYRKTADTWRFSTASYGLLPPTVAPSLGDAHPSRRGLHEAGSDFLQLGQGCVVPHSLYCVLQGWISPLPDPTDYALTVRMRISNDADGGDPPGIGTHLAFGVPTDAPFEDLGVDKTGYRLSLHTERGNPGTKHVRLTAWDPEGAGGDGAENQLYEITNPSGSNFDDQGFIVLRIRVNGNRVELAGMPAANPETGAPVWSYDTGADTVNPRAPELGRTYRGAYVFCGRSDPGINGANTATANRWRGLTYRAKAGG